MAGSWNAASAANSAACASRKHVDASSNLRHPRNLRQAGGTCRRVGGAQSRPCFPNGLLAADDDRLDLLHLPLLFYRHLVLHGLVSVPRPHLVTCTRRAFRCSCHALRRAPWNRPALLASLSARSEPPTAATRRHSPVRPRLGRCSYGSSRPGRPGTSRCRRGRLPGPALSRTLDDRRTALAFPAPCLVLKLREARNLWVRWRGSERLRVGKRQRRKGGGAVPHEQSGGPISEAARS